MTKHALGKSWMDKVKETLGEMTPDPKKEKDLLYRIVMSPGVYDGAPTLRNPEIPIEVILGLLGFGYKGRDVQITLSLSEEDLQAVFLYAYSLIEATSSKNFMARKSDGEVRGTSAR